MVNPFGKTVCVALIFVTGCASIHQNDVSAPDHKASTDGYLTLVGDHELRPVETLDFYEEAGATEALRLAEGAAKTFSRGRRRFWRDIFWGAGVGLVIAAAIGRRPDPAVELGDEARVGLVLCGHPISSVQRAA